MTGTILDDDAPPSISVADASVVEGDSGTVLAQFLVSLSAPSEQVVTVAFATAGQSATAGADYTETAGTLTFQPGQTSQTVLVPVAGDLLDEADETFRLTLSAPGNATLADPVAIGTILDDDDAPPSISVADASVVEGDSGTVLAQFLVSLSAPSEQVVTVAFATAGQSATGGADYTETAGTLTFQPGQTSQTVLVPVTGDILDEADETFRLTLSAPGNATLADPVAIGTILDDDAPVQAPILDITGPSLVDLQRLGFHAQPTSIVLTFSEELDPARATNVNNYRLVGPGRDRRFGSFDDRAFAIRSVVYDAATRTVTVLPANLLPLHGTVYQLTINGTAPLGLTDRLGNLLDGDGDGQPGGNLVREFGRTTGLRDLRRGRAGLGVPPLSTARLTSTTSVLADHASAPRRRPARRS